VRSIALAALLSLGCSTTPDDHEWLSRDHRGGERASIVVRPPEPLSFSPAPAQSIAHADSVELTWSAAISEATFHQVSLDIPCRSYGVATTHYARVLLRATPGSSAETSCTATVHLNVSGTYALPNGPFARVRGTQLHDVTTTFGLVPP
jgi:hypothetical protein